LLAKTILFSNRGKYFSIKIQGILSSNHVSSGIHADSHYTSISCTQRKYNIVNFNNVKNSSHMSTIYHALAAHEILINVHLIN